MSEEADGQLPKNAAPIVHAVMNTSQSVDEQCQSQLMLQGDECGAVAAEMLPQQLPQLLPESPLVSDAVASTSASPGCSNIELKFRIEGGHSMISRNEKDIQELQEICKLLWGNNIRADVFNRWSQGFEFSDVEPSALVQKQGGPCAVIAPVQAYILKLLLMDMPTELSLKDLTPDKCKSLLIQALCNILRNCKVSRFRIITLSTAGHAAAASGYEAKPATAHTLRGNNNNKSKDAVMITAPTAAIGGSSQSAPLPIDSNTPQQNVIEQTIITGAGVGGATGIADVLTAEPMLALSPGRETDDAADAVAMSLTEVDNDQISHVTVHLTPEQFHQKLIVIYFGSIEMVEQFYNDNYNILTSEYGVLLFMYAVFLTKGVENVTNELSDTSEQLIHNTYGYGAQALINLMLTGRAVAHVWDNDQDVGGLKLRGINEQSEIGFITLMEQMRYCTVGSFYKNPRNPVWVMGSDTHLTVLFSNEKRLVSPETPCEIARRVFKSFDPEGNNFIPTAVLQDVLATLDLVSEPEYVTIMQKRLDPENLGIILLNAFMDEFFPLEKRSTPDTFDLMHYNGIPGSNDGNKVQYNTGAAIMLESDLKSVCTSNPMMTCLQTKWPNIEITWQGTRLPSLN